VFEGLFCAGEAEGVAALGEGGLDEGFETDGAVESLVVGEGLDLWVGYAGGFEGWGFV
jgi:hypothetical protein